MNEIDKTPTELMVMLRTAETNMKMAETCFYMMVANKGKAKGKGKWKGKNKNASASASKPKANPKQALKPKGAIEKGDCHYCGKPGH